jgi:hypothetical protein
VCLRKAPVGENIHKFVLTGSDEHVTNKVMFNRVSTTAALLN